MNTSTPSRDAVATRLLDLARDIAKSAAPEATDVRVLKRPGDPLPDSPGKYLLLNAEGNPVAFGFSSAPAAPRYMARNVRNAQMARERLGGGEGNAVLTALATSELDGTSIAIFPLCKDLGRTQLSWFLQRPAVRRWALSWLRAVVSRTAHPPVDARTLEERFERPLEHIASLSGVVPEMRLEARTALARLRAGEWCPRLVLMHGDFWKGNILAGPGSKRRHCIGAQFVVIDWGTSEMDGYAFFDLVRISMSLGIGRAQLRDEIAAHVGLLGGAPEDARAYLLAALGHRALHLEFFPLANFLGMSAACHDALARALSSSKRRMAAPTYAK